jgi:hypothetical protein
MDKYPPFDPNADYEEKNYYFNRANNFFQQSFPLNSWFAERYFERMLNAILDYERSTGRVFNKGMVYANLGIAQVVADKFDLGIAHLLTAQEEDRPISPHNDILNSRLWRQFEYPVIFGFLSSLNSPPTSVNLTFDVDDAFLTQLVTEMEQDERIFFEGAIWQINLNLGVNRQIPNAYTRGILYSGLRNLCLLIETLLRKRRYALSPQLRGRRLLLWELLQRGLGNRGIYNPQLDGFLSADETSEFLNNLESIHTSGYSDESKRIYYLGLTRNFTAHHLDISETVASLSGDQFFENYYELVVANVLAAFLYLKYNGLV